MDSSASIRWDTSHISGLNFPSGVMLSLLIGPDPAFPAAQCNTNHLCRLPRIGSSQSIGASPMAKSIRILGATPCETPATCAPPEGSPLVSSGRHSSCYARTRIRARATPIGTPGKAACAEAIAHGVHSADVVLNILARQRDPGPPATILTSAALTLRHAPVADCARYDNLRRTV